MLILSNLAAVRPIDGEFDIDCFAVVLGERRPTGLSDELRPYITGYEWNEHEALVLCFCTNDGNLERFELREVADGVTTLLLIADEPVLQLRRDIPLLGITITQVPDDERTPMSWRLADIQSAHAKRTPMSAETVLSKHVPGRTVHRDWTRLGNK
jgi:hypothetical protein